MEKNCFHHYLIAKERLATEISPISWLHVILTLTTWRVTENIPTKYLKCVPQMEVLCKARTGTIACFSCLEIRVKALSCSPHNRITDQGLFMQNSFMILAQFAYFTVPRVGILISVLQKSRCQFQW